MRESVERRVGRDVVLVLEGRPRPLRGRIKASFEKTFIIVIGSTEYDLRHADVEQIRTPNGEPQDAPEET